MSISRMLLSCGKNAFGFDVTDCPYCRLYAKYGAPEIGPVICRFDETMSAGIDNLEFVRKGTLCGGFPKCDFLYQRECLSFRASLQVLNKKSKKN